MEDLRIEQSEEVQPLKLVNPDRYLRAPAVDRLQKTAVQQIPTNLNNFKQEMAYWTVNTELVLCPCINSIRISS